MVVGRKKEAKGKGRGKRKLEAGRVVVVVALLAYDVFVLEQEGTAMGQPPRLTAHFAFLQPLPRRPVQRGAVAGRGRAGPQRKAHGGLAQHQIFCRYAARRCHPPPHTLHNSRNAQATVHFPFPFLAHCYFRPPLDAPLRRIPVVQGQQQAALVDHLRLPRRLHHQQPAIAKAARVAESTGVGIHLRSSEEGGGGEERGY